MELKETMSEMLGKDLSIDFTEQDALKIVKKDPFVVVLLTEDREDQAILDFKKEPKFSKVTFLCLSPEGINERRKGLVGSAFKEGKFCAYFKNGNVYRIHSYPTEKTLTWMIEGPPKGVIEDNKTLNEVIAKGGKSLICFYEERDPTRFCCRARHHVYNIGETVEKINKDCGDKLKVYEIDMRETDYLANQLDVEGNNCFIFFKDGKEVKRYETPHLSDLANEAVKFANE